ncbi:sugar phosphate isomerase/epimerase [Flavobacteriaceae bacterium]|jgi:sugar phosphate isomerase/epimerase|nr:sugar phosphate isomerase/epimerase [Flavobacteriaceae bacterium]|tara:strand:- start:1598 stop:2506 length:909 start_codon:yes stop_codon:yes gene_type:complete
MERRNFNQLFALGTLGLAYSSPTYNKKISLAQWSLHRTIKIKKELSPNDFSIKAREMGFDAVEYVSSLYWNELKSRSIAKITRELVSKSNDNDIKNLLIMVDGEGDLAAKNNSKREKAIENHIKWIEMAHELGCHSIRVNLNGEKQKENWIEYSSKSLTKLCSIAKKDKINIIVENHGGLSSNAKLLAKVMKEVNLDNCGTLPDFGNFCIEKEDPNNYFSNCINEYDKYLGMEELMPYAKAVSAKSFDFNNNGEESTIDFKRIIDIVRSFEYKGYYGIEYEGLNLSEEKGILKTKKLLERHL